MFTDSNPLLDSLRRRDEKQKLAAWRDRQRELMQKKTSLQVPADAVRYVVVLPLIRHKLIYECSKRESI